MSRFKRFAYSLASGYVALAANIAFTLLSVPLALLYLSRAEFGLWAIVTQIAGYIALIDFGMSGVSRVLIDHKDDKASGRYGAFIKTTLLVSAVQGAGILVCGAGVGFGLEASFGVPEELGGRFGFLMIGQSVLLAAAFLTRVFHYMLAAHQRYDIGNFAMVGSFAANFAALWLGFHLDQGVYSLLWGQLAGWCVSVIWSIGFCIRLRLFPPVGAWGRASWNDFVELFVYGRDIFLFMLGGQLISASQTILIARTLGLETAALWAVCSRTFTLVQQLVYRVFDFSCGALAEMLVRREKDRLLGRFRSILVVSSSIGAVAAVLFATCNQPFVHLWSQGRMGWPVVNDVLLAVWLMFCVQVRSHTGLVGQTKEFGALRYIFFIEGVFFAVVALWVLRWGGLIAMLGTSILATMLFSYPYGVWRTSRFFGLSWREVAGIWSAPALRTICILAPVGLVAWWTTHSLAPQVRLAICGPAVGAAGLVALVQVGLEKELRQEILKRCPSWMQNRVRSFGHLMRGGRGGEIR